MKKMLTICFAVLYTLITSGFTVNVHYCMGELASIDLHESHDEGCSKCGMPVKGDCCQDEAKWLKVDDSQMAAKAFAGLSQSITAVPVTLQPAWLQSAIVQPVLQTWAPLHAPPLIPAVPLFTRHCTFLI